MVQWYEIDPVFWKMLSITVFASTSLLMRLWMDHKIA
jgi:hypothetical protein